jgi:hypothetical protein
MATTLLQRLPQTLQQLVPPLEGGPIDLLFPLYFGLGVLVLRLLAERTILPWFKRALKPYAAPDRLDKAAFKVFENAFTSTFCGTLAVWAWYVTLNDNGGCTPFNTKPCLSTWPDVPLTRQFQLVWLSIGGYYTYEMIGTLLRVGCILNTDMIIHHVITMTMMVSWLMAVAVGGGCSSSGRGCSSSGSGFSSGGSRGRQGTDGAALSFSQHAHCSSTQLSQLTPSFLQPFPPNNCCNTNPTTTATAVRLLLQPQPLRPDGHGPAGHQQHAAARGQGSQLRRHTCTGAREGCSVKDLCAGLFRLQGCPAALQPHQAR